LVSRLWLPPACKVLDGAQDVGYSVYDLYDLGEFEQKGSTRTKYRSRAGYLAAITALKYAGIQVYADTVLSHRIGDDSAETVKTTPYPKQDRLNPAGSARGIRCYTRFAFHHTVSYWISSFSPDAADISPSAGADSTRKFA